MILAIDPGNEQSAIVLMTQNYEIADYGKSDNEAIRRLIKDVHAAYENVTTVIEMVASYGMAVGQTIFDTCVWIGRFTELANNVEYVFRKDVKMNICGQTRAKDTNIRVALIDRFARHDFKNGKGTKKNPDYFYGFKADIWQAYAVGVTYLDTNEKGKRNEINET